jgi:hypothetical protein
MFDDLQDGFGQFIVHAICVPQKLHKSLETDRIRLFRAAQISFHIVDGQFKQASRRVFIQQIFLGKCRNGSAVLFHHFRTQTGLPQVFLKSHEDFLVSDLDSLAHVIEIG